MNRILIAPILLAFASHLAMAQDGSSTRAYLGVGLQPGALVGNVNDSGPAQAAGIQPGDLIIRFDGKEIKSTDELLQAVAATPVGKEVVIDVVRMGQQGTTIVKLGQQLVLSGEALEEFRQKLGGMLRELGSLGALRGSWNDLDLRKFSDLFAQFEQMKTPVPPADDTVQRLWGQLEREFKVYKPFADNLRHQREATEAQRGAQLEGKTEAELSALYVDYMTLQLCAERFRQFGNAPSQLREFLQTKEAGIPRPVTDQLWNSIAQKFQQLEVGLARASNSELYAGCEQASKQAAALVTRATEQSADGPPLRKKDF
jgi:hypothetical protein